MFRVLFTLLLQSRSQLRLTWKLIQDKRIPSWQKAIPMLPLIYIFSPFNLLTFAIPVIGQIDDIALVLMAMRLFESVVDDSILAEYKKH